MVSGPLGVVRPTHEETFAVTRVRFYGIASLFIFILVSILVACLWPFHSPANQVAWLADGKGLGFGRHGTIVTRESIKTTCELERRGCTVEIWLRPKFLWKKGFILGVYDPRRANGFSLRQSNGCFLVETGSWNKENIGKAQKFFAGNIFGRSGFSFLTVTSGPQGTKAYIDGALVRRAQRFRISADDLTGRVVVANSPVLPDGWSGDLKGLAIYNRGMTAAEVRKQYETWTQTGQPPETKNDGVVALYLFDEHAGSVIHDRAGQGDDLYLPKRYLELHHTPLRWPWDEYSPTTGYLEDVLINIIGFIPLGFFCYAYLSLIPSVGKPALATVILAFLVSLTVEVLQAYLPTRDSGMTDILTNTSGAALGVELYRCTSLVCSALVRSPYGWVRSLAALFVDKLQDVQDKPHRARGMR